MKGKWLRRPQNSVVVIFLHGVLSSIETCWRHEGGAFWPDLVMDVPETRQCGVYVFAYRSTIFSGTYRLGDVVDALKEQMRLDKIFDCHSIIFVAHSMGGIVARKLIVSRTTDFQSRNIRIGLFLVASPSLGSQYANVLTLFALAMKHTHAEALRFSQTNGWLMDLDREFINLKEAGTLKLVGKELIEDRFIFLKGVIDRQVVEPFSGARYFGEAIKIPNSDHNSIAKPDSTDALQHRLLVNFIEEFVDGESLPIEYELKDRLQDSLNSCRDAGVPFRTFHRLAVLFSMQSEFTVSCFEEAETGKAAKVEGWLHQTIAHQIKSERGLPSFRDPLKDLVIGAAGKLAKADGATQIDERHYLLAVLNDRDAATIAELRRGLTEAGFEKVRSAAQYGSLEPFKPSRSNVLKLDE
ncbi:alpha/beta fold hydrolase [Beijerinckia mobilis]|uniref:alpha/beta fold hydrolase n=1 Tax=Beijerinckia mobilis TaxID=231434 RepID=UPI00068F821A|nr:alpha/beta fold hydrolase [Beijerinckia mobilis]